MQNSPSYSRKWIFLSSVLGLLLVAIFIFDKWPQRIYHRIKPVPEQIDPVENVHYLNMSNEYKTLSTHNKVVMFGNSIIQNAMWSEILHSNNVVNRGISGDRSEGMVLRLAEYLKDTPTCVVMLVDINDIQYNVPTTAIKWHYETMLNQVKQSNIPMVVMSCLPKSTDSYLKGISLETANKRVDSVNVIVSQMAKERGFTFLDIRPALTKNGILENSFSYDGLHLNGVGYSKLKEPLLPVIKQYL